MALPVSHSMGTEIPVQSIKGSNSTKGPKLHPGVLFTKQMSGGGIKCPGRSYLPASESTAEDVDQSFARDRER